MGRKAHRSSHRKRELVRDFIQNNPNASNEDVAKAVMVSESLASKVRTELRNAGVVKPLANDRTSKPAAAPKPDAITVTTEDVTLVGTKQLLDLVAAEEKALHRGLTVPEQEKLLIKFAYDQEQSLATRMAAMDKYNKLQSDQGSRDALGPGKPLTEEDMILRLSFLCKAAGFTVAVKAFERAFKKGPTNEGQVPAESSEVASSPVGVVAIAPSIAAENGDEGTSGT